jgi:hypothetical protein
MCIFFCPVNTSYFLGPVLSYKHCSQTISINGFQSRVRDQFPHLYKTTTKSRVWFSAFKIGNRKTKDSELKGGQHFLNLIFSYFHHEYHSDFYCNFLKIYVAYTCKMGGVKENCYLVKGTHIQKRHSFGRQTGYSSSLTNSVHFRSQKWCRIRRLCNDALSTADVILKQKGYVMVIMNER